MGLFGNKADKQARLAAGAAESQRLRSLPARALAAEVMPAFGPDGMNFGAAHRQGPMEVVRWLLPGAAVRDRQPVLGPVVEALGVLEHANLLTRRSAETPSYYASRLGIAALAGGTVRTELGFQDS